MIFVGWQIANGSMWRNFKLMTKYQAEFDPISEQNHIDAIFIGKNLLVKY